jgi:hypothetical protein
MTIFVGGLRVSQVAHLRVRDVDPWAVPQATHA